MLQIQNLWMQNKDMHELPLQKSFL